ncbi:BQ2448_5578 [Microbotryum intermedium]|uniref:BQ2448_5578 protein n=1 Tax=Microbotryum intermedium TaxID=269621 RepID=A0A238EYG6_9BASI|nr:BQ2448_5578 [Microbotryum intermedium]
MSDKHHHRASLKQSNKSFKSKHSTKSALKDAAKGRTHRPSSSSPKTSKTNANLSASQHKLNRRNHAKQVQDKKRHALDSTAKLFSGPDRAQRIVAIVPMSEDVDPLAVVELLAATIKVEIHGQGGYRVLDAVKFHNQSLRFLLLPSASEASSLFPILDGCSAADFVILGLSSSIQVNEQGETMLRCLTATGVASVLGVTPDLPKESQLMASTTRTSLTSFLNHFFPTIEKVADLSSPSEATTIVRGLCEKVPKSVKWREARPRILAEVVQFEKGSLGSNGDAEMGGIEVDGGVGTLVIEGTVRGARLDANRLVHLHGFGDFQVEKILAAPPTRRPRKSTAGDSMDLSGAGPSELSVPQDDDADSLVSTNVSDEEEFGLAEQTWPTEEELASAPAAIHSTSSRVGESDMLPPARKGTTPRLRKVPKGTSAYQAAWIIEESDEEDGGSMEDDDEDENGEEQEIIDMNEPEGQGEDEGNLDFVDDSQFDDTASQSVAPYADLSPEQEEAQLAQYLANRAQERALQNKDDMDFPDEMDTPLHISARERFARYRGLKSFRTSRWDPYEELPVEYSRCFMFEDFKRIARKMEMKAQLEGVEAGTRVILRIKNVPRAVFEAYSALRPFVVYGLLKHEHKYSVMHFTVQRNTEYLEPVRSKDSLVLQLGPRRFVINPIFSAHTLSNGGKGTNNVHKFERFLRHGIDSHIATAYLPITFGNVPALLLRVPSQASSGSDEFSSNTHLIGTGSLLSADPTRITAKRIILTGYPFKVHKKTATIRYLFFNRADVDYFKPIQLRTKRGRTGYIREPLGTHGYFKAGFDGPIDQMDQICLTLYKRCYPKWTTQYYKAIE